MKKLQFTPNQIKLAIELYAVGESLQTIGKTIGASKPTVKKLLIENDIEIRKSNILTDAKKDKFLKYFKKTGSVLKSRKYAHIGQGTALRILKEESSEKVCIHCGSKDIITTKNGRTYPCCAKCKEHYFFTIQEKRRETTLEKYGVEHIAQLQETKDKKKEACLAQYGYEHHMQNPEFLKEFKDRRVQELGVDNIFKTGKFKKYMINYNQENFGVSYTPQRDDVRQKISTTHKNISRKEQTRRNELRKQTTQNLWGYSYTSQVPQVKEKVRQTFKERYGGTCSFDSPEIREKINFKNREKYWNTFIKLLDKKKIEPLFSKEYYITNLDKPFRYKCLKCNNIFESNSITPIRIWCGCGKSRSQYEDEIIDWLKSLGIESEPNAKFYKDGSNVCEYEVDIFLEKFSIGIEFHGLYWHSNIYKENNYHKNKYLYFKERGIQLIQIFENEWMLKKEIVQSIIKNKLNLSTVVYARKCELKKVSSKESKLFLDENHIQSSSIGSVKEGLYFNDSLVALIVIGKSRFSKEAQWEIIRFANKIGVNVVGGFQRLLKHFERTYSPKSIVSFVDVRYFNGSSLEKDNFIKIKHTRPNYFYFKTKDVINTFSNRLSFQKHKLKDKLEIFDPKLSEYENMMNNNYLRIFDAGNLKMIKSFSND